MSDSSVSTVSDETMSAQAKTRKVAARQAAAIVIVATNFLLNLGYPLWRSLFNNFAVVSLILVQWMRVEQVTVSRATVVES